MNGYISLANLVVGFHLFYVGFVVLMVPVILIGGWRKWSWVRNFWFRLIHFIMIAVVVVETVFGVTCPLTTWETELRVAGGQLEPDPMSDRYLYDPEAAVYQEDFVGQLFHNLLFLNDVPQWVLNCCYFAFGAMILVMLLFIPPRSPWKQGTSLPQVAATTA